MSMLYFYIHCHIYLVSVHLLVSSWMNVDNTKGINDTTVREMGIRVIETWLPMKHN